MKKLLFILFYFSLNLSLFSQVESVKYSDEGGKKFFVDLLNFYTINEKQGRLDVFIQVPYQSLQFVKEDLKFVASYEISLDVYNSTSQLEVQRTYNKQLSLDDFNATISKKNYDLSQKSFNLKPGKYKLEVILTDNDSRKSYKSSKEVELRDYSLSKVGISDLMLVSKINIINDKKSLIPNVSGNVGNLQEGFHVFFEIYSDESRVDSANIMYAVFNKKDKKVFESTVKYFISGKVTPVFLQIQNKDLVFGDYKLVVKVLSEKYSEEFKNISIGRVFLVRWQDMPVSINDINLAIAQMRYIIEQKDLDTLLAAKDEKERQKKFLEYWKDRKPSMEEYFARVDYANEKFKGHREGWRTDMGMVFITFGAPDNVDRHPFDLDAVPYEVWDYYNLNRRFIFMDETGFGEYRLVNPFWERDPIRPY